MLTIEAYFHILFVLALVVPYEFKSWKKIIILISIFTLAHCITTTLCAFNFFTPNTHIISFLVPVSILIVALYNIISSGKLSKKDNILVIAIITGFYGLIHGLGYYSYFSKVLSTKPTDKLLPIFEFGLGIEVSQITIALLALLAGYVIQTLFKFSKRDWTLTISGFIVGVMIPLIMQHKIWLRL